MHDIYNLSDTYFLWNIEKQKMSFLGNREEIIRFLAKAYQKDWYDFVLRNIYLDNFGCNTNETGKLWQFFDGYERCINPKLFEKEAFKLWQVEYKNKNEFNWKKHRICKKTYPGEYRKDPVAHTGKIKGGPFCKNRRVTHIKRMYDNPEYKEYNRGSHKFVPMWWDDQKWRTIQRSWKSHRRHQWKNDTNY